MTYIAIMARTEIRLLLLS